ncbi:MAG: VCBS repeat-containing protein [Deltaproteobacteria bacterium]|nr:VCBS repeat-containing protein [Deltaproteobacteria bacterium]
MKLTSTITIAFALALGCQAQRKDKPRDEVDPSQLVSRAEDPSAVATTTPQPQATPPTVPAARLPLPPLPDPLPGVRKDVTSIVGSAWRAAIADLDGDGDREIVLVDSKQMRVVDPSGRELATVAVARGIQALVAADIDGDRHAEIIAGWGVTRDHMGTKAAFTVHRLQKGRLSEETVLAPETTRQDVVAIVPMPDAGSVLLAYFDSKYVVSSVVAKRSAHGWETSKLASIRTATSYARGDVDGDGAIDLVIGRVYGDDKGLDGDAFVLASDGTRKRIPTTRGLRSLAVADGDGDGRPEVFIGDGWHQNYGDNARGLLTWARPAGNAFTSELIENTAGQYAIERIVPATIDGKPAIVTVGSNYVRVFQRTGGAWRGLTIAGIARDVAVGDLDGVPGDEILIVGEKSETISLRDVTWSDR